MVMVMVSDSNSNTLIASGVMACVLNSTGRVIQTVNSYAVQVHLSFSVNYLVRTTSP